MKSFNNSFTKYVVSALLAAAAWPSLAFVPAYPPIERAAATIRPNGAADRFGHNGLGNMAAHTNAEGNVYTLVSDALGRVTAATNALGHQAFRAHEDNAGNPTNRTDGAGNSVRHAYDTLNRLTDTIAIAPSASLSSTNRFAYDAVGNMTLASNAVATLAFAYDSMNRLTNAITKAGAATFATRWQRDPGGLVTNLTYATGKSVTYTYDADGLLASVKDWQGNQWTFTRDATGKLTAMSSPDGTVSGYAYDNAGRLTSWNAGTLAGRAITYDAAGKRIRDDITAGAIPKPTLQRTALNTFDAADRLVSASVRYGQGADSTPHITETFSYDGNGAMTNWVSSTNLPFTVHDLSLSYDALGQVASVSDDHQFSYDAFGNRLKTKTQQLGTILWIPNHSDPLKRPLMECDASGNVIRYYIWGGNILLGYVDGVSGELTVGHADETGSVIALTDATGTVLHTACYGPHGQDWGSTGHNPTPFTWLGGYGVQAINADIPVSMTNSDTLFRLYLTRHRVYSATLNRFLSSDPLGLAGGLNLYQYGEGNPMAYIDPLGLCAQSGGGWGSVGNVLSTVGTYAAMGVDAVWNTALQFINTNPNFGEHQSALSQGLVNAIGSPFQKLGVYGQGASPIMAPTEVVNAAWGAAASIAALPNLGANGVGSPPLYHYTSSQHASSISAGGIRTGGDGFIYATPVGNLTPFSAQVSLALPITRAQPDALFRIDANGLGQTGILPVIGPRNVQGNLPGMGAGGGTGVLYGQPIPPQYLQRVR